MQRRVMKAVTAMLLVAAAAVPATAVPAAGAITPPLQPHNSITITRTPPGSYRPAEPFSITLLVTLKKPDKHAYLLSFIQHSLKPCQPNAGHELQRTLSTHGAYYHHEFGRAPYTTTSDFTAGAPGNRRVCAYLFRAPIPPGSGTTPVAIGTAAYQVSR